VLIWVLSKLGGLFTGFPTLFNTGTGEGSSEGEGGEGSSGEGDGGGGGIMGELERGAKEVEGDLGEVGE
jgi:hypothetical protein